MLNDKSIYRLTVKTKTALHIGTAVGPDDVSDSLFRRDSQGRLTLPGTSIAGAIRSHLTRLTPVLTGSGKKVICDALRFGSIDETRSCACIVCHLMGDIRPLNEIRTMENGGRQLTTDELEQFNGRASRLIVHDAPIPPKQTQIRDGVGIDRTTGAAAWAASAKFDFETIPAGTCFGVVLELEDAEPMDDYLLKVALYEWQKGRLRFGGNRSRGTGVLVLEKVEVTKFTLSNHVDLMRFLRRNIEQPELCEINPPHRDYHSGYAAVPHSVQSWVTVDFDLQAQGFFLTNDTTRATAEGYNHRSLPFLPGASLRGAIRSQAERIARTLVNLRSDVQDEVSFLNHCPAANPFVTYVEKQSGIESSAARIRRGREDLRADKQIPAREDPDAYDLSEQLFGSVDWGSRLAVEDAAIVDEDGNSVDFEKLKWKKLDFVAIDRFTGGAADGAKFDAYALWKPRFKCRLYLEAPRDWEIGWLLYVLKDMIDRHVPIGFGAAKGFGDVTLENLVLTLGYAYPEAASLRGLPQAQDSDPICLEKTFNGWAEVNQTHWLQDWNNTLNSFTVQVGHHHITTETPEERKTYRDPYWRNEEVKDEDNFLPLHLLYNRNVRIDDYFKPE